MKSETLEERRSARKLSFPHAPPPTPPRFDTGENSNCLPAKEGLYQCYLLRAVKSQDLKCASHPELQAMAKSEGLTSPQDNDKRLDGA